ncbi:helix-turn-helix transcriptional regulator [uncultured Tateyamaria sp.]|uniref:helix-turn-helix domain-containing protein n=1 Tax=uncultured Tateyamaria sp. TaxID=455651 RepID=UPI00261668C8|nr:helix-turn-helix transcriptional regulator [uncultured Tateyamaria sp.]
MSFKLQGFDGTPEEEHAAEEAAMQAMINDQTLAQALSVKVHENLEAFRKKRKFKKAEMAEMMGVSSRSYYMYETGKRAIPSSALVQLEAFTGADLNEVLLGGAKSPKLDKIKFVVDEAIKALCFLGHSYENMPMETKRAVIDRMFARQPDGVKARPDDIIGAVRSVTRYKYHPEDLPAPPLWESYMGDQRAYERDMAERDKIIAEDFPDDEAGKEASGN